MIEATAPVDESTPTVEVEAIDLGIPVETRVHPSFAKGFNLGVRHAPLLNSPPWIRSAGSLSLSVTTQGWRFPIPMEQQPSKPEAAPKPAGRTVVIGAEEPSPFVSEQKTRPRPPLEKIQFKERLLYLLQPPLEDMFTSTKVSLPFQPFPYQVKGIAFLMPRDAALIADEMGLGKTVQVIVSLRLLFQSGLIKNALVVCPKPLVINWSRELRTWAPDIPFEVIGGDTEARKVMWQVSNCPVKLVNYELLTRDVEFATAENMKFDVVVLDEAQRIKTKGSKTANVVCSLRRGRSWAMSGTPIENSVEDLVNIFAFVDPGRIPPDTPPKMLPALTSDYILRRTKEMVVSDMPPRIIKDMLLELSPLQREAYDRAEKDGVIHLNELGSTITVQHVFELVMRLKQICNFEPRTGDSSKLEQLLADMEEVAANGRKAIIFSQWTEPLERLAKHLQPYGPLLYHGKIPHKDRQPILDRFKTDPTKHVILMSYGTGSVGLNLQFTNYVFLYDRWWNPAIEDQAINRAHRLGQKAPVFVSRFVSTNTIEERIAEILDQKRALFNEMLEGNGPPPNLGLSEEEVFGLFDIQARPKRAG